MCIRDRLKGINITSDIFSHALKQNAAIL